VATTPPRLTTEPTERSMPPRPVRITRASPTPTAAMNEKLRAIWKRLSVCRKRGARRVMSAMSRMRAARMASS